MSVRINGPKEPGRLGNQTHPKDSTMPKKNVFWQQMDYDQAAL